LIALLATLLTLPVAMGGRTAINTTSWVENSYPTSTATATALDSANNHYIPFVDGLVFRVVESGGVANDTLITVLAGDDPPSFRAGIGNATFTITNATAETWIGPFEPARFMNASGYLLINTNSTDGTITAFKFPT